MKKMCLLLSCLLMAFGQIRASDVASATPASEQQGLSQQSDIQLHPSTPQSVASFVVKLWLRTRVPLKLNDWIGTIQKYAEYVGEMAKNTASPNERKAICFTTHGVLDRVKLQDYLLSQLAPFLDEHSNVKEWSIGTQLLYIKNVISLSCDAFADVNPNWRRDVPRAVAEVWLKNSLRDDLESFVAKLASRNQPAISENLQKVVDELPEEIRNSLKLPQFMKNRPWIQEEIKEVGKGFIRAFADNLVMRGVHGVSDIAFGAPFSRQ